MRARCLGSLPVCYSQSALEQATHNWSEDLLQGHGGFSEVYRGYIHLAGAASRETVVAIKRLKRRGSDLRFWKRFYRELILTVRHPNVVSLLGYCEETPALVFEFMGGGSLLDVLRSL